MKLARSPMVLSVDLLGAMGYVGAPVERRLTRTIKVDFLGLGDALGIRRKRKPLLIQATDWTSVGKHVTKMRKNPNLKRWKAEGGEVRVWGWKRVAGVDVRTREVIL